MQVSEKNRKNLVHADADTLDIIVATFNRAHTLPRMINSLLHQTDPRWRLIVIDDGSTDSTSGVMSRYMDERIQYYPCGSNRGPSYVRNLGVRYALSEYIAFLDSDDELVPDAIAHTFKLLEDDKHRHWGYAFPCLDSDTGQIIGCWPKDGEDLTYQDVITGRYEGEAWIVIRQAAFNYYQFNETFSGYERMFWYSALKDLGPFFFSSKPLRKYFRGTEKGSLMRTTSEPSSQAQQNSKLQTTAYLKLFEEDLRELNPKGYVRELLKLGIAYLYLEEYREARCTFEQAWDVAPNWRILALWVMAATNTALPLKLRRRLSRR